MAKKRIEYVSHENPIRPGSILSDVLEDRGLQKQEFATRCGRTPKLISEIISGVAPITPETALQFERVLKVPASFWVNLEAKYQIDIKRRSEEQDWSNSQGWIQKFPFKEIAKRAGFLVSNNPAENVKSILSFFGVASIKACEDLFASRMLGVQYRRTVDFSNDTIHEQTWLRLGEQAAQKVNCAPYDAKAFRSALPTFRSLTHLPIEKFIDKLRTQCAKCGVAVVLVPELSKTHTSGATYWPTKDKAVIQLSNRGKSNDIFWFNFFHEACHVLNHSKKKIYWDVDPAKNNESDQSEIERIEQEANEFSANMLIPEDAYRGYFRVYKTSPRYSERNIREYSEKIGIAPGVLLGQLQKRGIVRWNTGLNKSLKLRLEIPE